jgi:hypothetical protein
MSHPLNTPLGRFGIVTSEEGPQRCIASIPAGGMINPLTEMPTVAPLAMLVDHIGGLINHHRREPGEWTVSSELSLELAPDALTQITSAPELPVIGTGRPCGRKGPNALGLCEFTHRDSVVATATLRSFYIEAPGNLAKRPEGPTGPLPPGSLADRMAVRVAEGGGAGKVLVQDSDQVLNKQPWHRARRGIRDGAGAGRLCRRQRKPGRSAAQHRIASRELSASVPYLCRWARISLRGNRFAGRSQ